MSDVDDVSGEPTEESTESTKDSSEPSTESSGPSTESSESTEQSTESTLPEVPESVDAAVEGDDHALALEDLQYPEFTFDEGSIDGDGGFDLRQELDREEMESWLAEFAGGLTSHDIGVEAADGRVILGVAPNAAEFSFDPNEDHVGDFEVSFKLRAKAMVVNDADDPKVGARGGKGFIPLAMLTDDEDKPYRCYNWIEDPTDG